MTFTPEAKLTDDGSITLYLKELDEHYHSTHGAATESKHVFIEAGLKALNKQVVSIFEMGFGTGLNALLTMDFAESRGIKVDYTSLEKYPVSLKLSDSLNHRSFVPHLSTAQINTIYSSNWGRKNEISENFALLKINADLLETDFPGLYDMVYFDAFAPDKQPELWTTDVFRKLFQCMNAGSVLTTYSSKGAVRRNLKAAGFRVEKLPGPPGKRDITRAWKD